MLSGLPGRPVTTLDFYASAHFNYTSALFWNNTLINREKEVVDELQGGFQIEFFHGRVRSFYDTTSKHCLNCNNSAITFGSNKNTTICLN